MGIRAAAIAVPTYRSHHSGILAAIAVFALTACSPRGYISTIPVAPEQAAQLTVIRLPLLEGSGNTWVVSVDEHQVLGLRAGEHATVIVPAGDRIITSDCVTAFPVVRPGAPIRVPVKAGGHHYVTLGSCMMAEVTEATAEGLIAQTKPVAR